jgi:hypothetical protein
LAKHTATAATACPSIASKRVSPHVLRHYVAFRTMSSDFRSLCAGPGIMALAQMAAVNHST